MKNNSYKVLKITFFNHFKSLFWLIFLFSCLFSGILYMSIKDTNLSNNNGLFNLPLGDLFALLFGAVVFSFPTLPALFFHLDYLMRNKNEEYEIGNKKIIKKKNGVEKVYNFEDIYDVYMYVSLPKFRKDPFIITAWDDYHYAKIIMKSGEVLYLTSLLYPSGLEKVFKQYMKGVNYWRERRLFPTTLINFSHDKHDIDEYKDDDEVVF